MTVFLMAVFYGLLKTGSLIALLVDAYKGWTLFWKNYGRCEQVPDMRSSYSSGAHPRGTS